MELVMKIIALSDLHGNLISIRDKCDVVVIAGDWSPLYCQHDYLRVLDWIDKRFIRWMSSLNTNHVVFIPGNHDLVCVYSFFRKEFNKILARHRESEYNIHYLCYSSVVINGLKFYGTPNSESPNGWAFSNRYNQTYSFDGDTDILITHQPPKVGDVGYARQINTEFGSEILLSEIMKSNIRLNICGHIHTGSHEKHSIKLKNGSVADVYNVSILDEEYQVAYEPAIIEV